MGEKITSDDCWSLLDMVQECAPKIQHIPQLTIENIIPTTLGATTTTTASTTTVSSITAKIDPIKTNVSQTPFLGQVYKNSQTPIFNQNVIQNNNNFFERQFLDQNVFQNNNSFSQTQFLSQSVRKKCNNNLTQSFDQNVFQNHNNNSQKSFLDQINVFQKSINNNRPHTLDQSVLQKTKNNSQAPIIDQIVFQKNNNNSPTSFINQNFLQKTNNNSPTPILNQVLPKNNPNTSMLPLLATGAMNNVASVANGSMSKTQKLKGLKKPFSTPQIYNGPIFGTTSNIPLVQTHGMCSNLAIEAQPSSHQHLQLEKFRNHGSSNVVVDHDNNGRKRLYEEDRKEVRISVNELKTIDEWSWRKYGQKPIKGNIYPRSYYKCNYNDGCKAKKHVESTTDPNFYHVTYTGEHYHPPPAKRNPYALRRKSTGPRTTVLASIMHGYENGFEFGGNVVKFNENVDMDVSGATNGESSRRENNNNNNNYDILIPNLMVDPDLFMGMNHLSRSSSSGKNTISNGSTSYSNNYVDFNEIAQPKIGCDPNLKVDVQVKKIGSGYDFGEKSDYVPATVAGAPKPPNIIHENIWEDEMIDPQSFFFDDECYYGQVP